VARQHSAVALAQPQPMELTAQQIRAVVVVALRRPWRKSAARAEAES